MCPEADGKRDLGVVRLGRRGVLATQVRLSGLRNRISSERRIHPLAALRHFELSANLLPGNEGPIKQLVIALDVDLAGEVWRVLILAPGERLPSVAGRAV